MISGGNELGQSHTKLLPHQNALLDTFFSADSTRVILLSGDVGIGKTSALVALVGRLLRQRQRARVLFLLPAGLRWYFVEMLRQAGNPTLLVDRYKFREMLDSNSDEDLWPSGTATVLSLDFAKQRDIRDSLAETHWDLVIADEAHLIRGTRGDAFRTVVASAERVLVATASDIDVRSLFPAEVVTVVEWRRDQVVDHEGKPFDSELMPTLRETHFSLNEGELTLRATVNELSEAMGGATGIHSFWVMSLLRNLESSPAAIERTLERLAKQLIEQEELADLISAEEEETAQEKLVGQEYRAIAKKVSGITARALQEIEESGTDSKLEAFGRLLRGLGAEVPPRRICVFTQFLGTLYYLATEIEDQGKACQLLHGHMSADDRLRSLKVFSTSGVILVASPAVMTEGPAMPEVTDLILYDVPGSKGALQQILGRFHRIGRFTQLNVHVLTPSDSSDGFIEKNLHLLRDLLAAQVKSQQKH